MNAHVTESSLRALPTGTEITLATEGFCPAAVLDWPKL